MDCRFNVKSRILTIGKLVLTFEFAKLSNGILLRISSDSIQYQFVLWILRYVEEKKRQNLPVHLSVSNGILFPSAAILINQPDNNSITDLLNNEKREFSDLWKTELEGTTSEVE